MTNTTARPMPAAVSSLLEQPRNGQQPKNCEKMKLLIRIALKTISMMVAFALMLQSPPFQQLLSFSRCA